MEACSRIVLVVHKIVQQRGTKLIIDVNPGVLQLIRFNRLLLVKVIGLAFVFIVSFVHLLLIILFVFQKDCINFLVLADFCKNIPSHICIVSCLVVLTLGILVSSELILKVELKFQDVC